MLKSLSSSKSFDLKKLFPLKGSSMLIDETGFSVGCVGDREFFIMTNSS
jgi:hypothetical protein